MIVHIIWGVVCLACIALTIKVMVPITAKVTLEQLNGKAKINELSIRNGCLFNELKGEALKLK